MRGCADGGSQREYISKLEPSSPSVKTHAFFHSCLVDAFERRKVVIASLEYSYQSTGQLMRMIVGFDLKAPWLT